MSIRDAVQNERVIATLGKQNFTNINMELLTDKVVLCLDNDGHSIKEDKVLVQAIERLQLHGKTVEIAIPSKLKDFNDVKRADGLEGVINTLSTSFNANTLHLSSNKVAIDEQKIKTDSQAIPQQFKIEIQEKNHDSIENIKALQREEMEI